MLATLVSLIMTLGGTPQAAASRGVTVSGVVQDQTGAILPGAEVTLRIAGSPRALQTAVSDAGGLFHLERVAPGNYDVGSAFPASRPT